jgi:hypothetical protein
MSTPPASTPSTSPIGAPEIASIQQLQDKKTDALAFLHDKSEFSDADKISLAAEFDTALSNLMSKKAAEKDRDIGDFIKTELEKLKTNIHNEKKDANEDKDEVLGTDETTDSGEQKLNVEKEIRGRLDEFRTSIETKLAAPATPETPPTASPEPAAEVAEDFLPALNIDADLPDIPEFRNPKKKWWIVEMIINWLGTEGIFWWFRKNIMGYNDVEEMTDTMTAMNNIMSIKKESPVSSIINLSHLTEYDFRDILRKNNKLDFSNMRNVEAAFLGKYAKDPKLAPYHSIYRGIEDMAGKISTLDASSYNPIQGFAELLSYSKKPEFAPEYAGETVAVADVTPTPETPTLTEAEEEAEALKSAQEIDKEKTEAEAALAREEAIPDNPDAINVARERLNKAEEVVKKSIDDTKKDLEEYLAEEDANLKNITEIEIPMAQRSLKEAESALAGDPENTELQTKKETLQKNLDTLTKKEENLKNALAKIQENIVKKFETPGITTALAATNLLAEADSIIDIANGVTEIAEAKTENQTAEEKEKEEKESEKIKKEKEKMYGMYKKVKESKEKYYYDSEEGFVYIVSEQGDLCRYLLGWNWWNPADWLASLYRKVGDYNLPTPIDLWDDQNVEMISNDGTWKKSWIPAGSRDYRKRAQMTNDAPDTPDWYNS